MGFRRLQQRGDTIVEVLIAIAVVSSVLAITYSIMNRNISTLRDNQERSEASKLAQSQIERLKSAWGSADPAAFPGEGNTQPFCMAPDVTHGFENSAPATNMVDDNFSEYPDVCIDGFYHSAIRYNDTHKSYIVTVRWDSVTGVRAEVVMGYKLQ